MNIFNLLFILPHIIDLFPEIKLFMPKQTIKGGKNKKCKTDFDCNFPAVCCNFPFSIDKECCTGFGHRIPKSNYAFN
jgi:hypothetical protein